MRRLRPNPASYAAKMPLQLPKRAGGQPLIDSFWRGAGGCWPNSHKTCRPLSAGCPSCWIPLLFGLGVRKAKPETLKTKPKKRREVSKRVSPKTSKTRKTACPQGKPQFWEAPPPQTKKKKERRAADQKPRWARPGDHSSELGAQSLGLRRSASAEMKRKRMALPTCWCLGFGKKPAGNSQIRETIGAGINRQEIPK